MKRIISFLLCVVMLFGMMPGLQASATEEVAPVVETQVPETTPQETEAPETEAPAEETLDSQETTETAATEDTASEAAETDEIITAEDIVKHGDLADVEEEYPDNQEMATGYVENLFYNDGEVPYGTTARNNLTAAEKNLYDYLKNKSVSIASNGGTTEFTISTSSLGIGSIYFNGTYSVGGKLTQAASDAIWSALPDNRKVVLALLYDCPYEMYWFDKTLGWEYGVQNISYNSRTKQITVGKLYIALKVNNYYGYRFTVYGDNEIATAKKSVANAKSIVNQYAGKSDYQKLLAYKEKICSMVTYDYDAVENDSFQQNMNPWQLVYAFDNNPNTNIVCEGYSKAFQYLCDQSTFNDKSLYCISVDGVAGGPHMWNIVHIGGQNYTVDVTWCDDENSTGGSEEMFLKAPTYGSYRNGYTYTYGYRYYEDDCLNAYTASQLSLSFNDYTPPCVHNFGNWKQTKAPTCTEAGSQKRTCSKCKEVEIQEIAALGHDYILRKAVDATSSRTGYTGDWGCTRCSTVFEKGSTIPKGTAPMYRLYNQYTLEHLFLSDAEERWGLIISGWTDEGIGWYAAISGNLVYRLYNPFDDFHFYSKDKNEINGLTPHGWTVDGPVSHDAGPSGVPIYRLFNPYETVNYHHYTTDMVEVNFLTSLGWRLEGVAWYAAKAA